MQMERFTTLAQEVLAGAQSAATGREHAELTPLHLLASMLEDRQGVVGSILAKAGVEPERVRDVAEAELGRRPRAAGATPRTSNAAMQVAILNAVELYVTESAPNNFKKLVAVLKALYDEDVCEEEAIVKIPIPTYAGFDDKGSCEDILTALGGKHTKSEKPFGVHVTVDERVVCGQNPPSADPCGAAIVELATKLFA